MLKKIFIILLCALTVNHCFSNEGKKKELNILVIADELVCKNPKGGIGTYNGHLIRFLQSKGHHVSVLCLDDIAKLDKTQLQKIYPKITFIDLPKWVGPKFLNKEKNIQDSYKIYHFLKDQSYDVIFFADYQGFGYYLTEAKQQGIAFEKTLLVGTLHGPSEWLDSLNASLIEKRHTLLNYYIEKQSIENCDLVHVLTPFFEKRIQEEMGWTLPRSVYTFPAFLSILNTIPPFQHCPIKEIIFIGRPNRNKGFDLFTKMIQTIQKNTPEILKDIQITFIAPYSIKTFQKNNPDLKNQIRHIRNFKPDDIIQYVTDPSRLVVLTSRGETYGYVQAEVLYHGAKFIGLNNGSLGDMIVSDDIDKVLVPSLNISALTEKLTEVLKTSTVLQARPKYDAIALQNGYDRFNNLIIEKYHQLQKTIHTIPTKQPLISVCMAHYNRPEKLLDALKSLKKQDYKNFEVIVVDDGSSTENKKKLKDSVEPYLNENGWKIFYQKNKYLSAARNHAASHAKGEWLLFMDDDNLALPNELSALYKIAHNTKAEIVTANRYVAFKDMTSLTHIKLDFTSAFVANVDGENCIGDANSLISKKAFHKIGGWYDEYGFGFSDQKLFIDAAAKGIKRVVSVEPLFIYNFIGQDHMGIDNSENGIYEINLAFDSYNHMMHKDLRNLAYYAFSLYRNVDYSKVSFIELIQYKIKKLTHRIISFFN